MIQGQTLPGFLLQIRVGFVNQQPYGISKLGPSLCFHFSSGLELCQMTLLHGFGLKTSLQHLLQFGVTFISFRSQVPISGLGSPNQPDSQPQQFGLVVPSVDGGYRFKVFNPFGECTSSRKRFWRNEWSRDSDTSTAATGSRSTGTTGV